MHRGLTPPVIVILPDPRDLLNKRRTPSQTPEKKNNEIINSSCEPSSPVEKDTTFFDSEDKKKNHQPVAKNRAFVIFASGICRCFRSKKNEKVIEAETGPEIKYQF